MTDPEFPICSVASEAALRTKPTNYPEPFASRMARREKLASIYSVLLTSGLPDAPCAGGSFRSATRTFKTR